MSNEDNFCGKCTCFWACQLFSDVTLYHEACPLFENKQTKKREQTEAQRYEARSHMPSLDARN